MERRQRQSRFPAKGKEHPIERPSARHKRIFRHLDPFYGFKFLTTSAINFLEPVDPIYNSQMLGHLYQSPNFYLDRDPEQQKSHAYHYRDAVYSIGEAAKRCLANEGYVWREAKHRSSEFAHEFNIDMGFYVPMMVAVKQDPSFTLIDTSDLFEHSNMPRSTRESDTPFTVMIDGERVRLDGRPVVLNRTCDGRTTSICIPGIQHERNTKGVRVKDLERSSVGKHVRHAIAAHERGLYERHFGFDTFVLPFLFTNDSQMRLTLDYIEELRPGGCEFIICKTIPDLAHLDRFPKPSADYFLTPWKRASHHDFVFNDAAFFPRS